MNLYVLQNVKRDGVFAMVADDPKEMLFFLDQTPKQDFKYFSHIMFREPRERDGAVGFVFDMVFDKLKLWTVYEINVPENHDNLKKGYLY